MSYVYRRLSFLIGQADGEDGKPFLPELTLEAAKAYGYATPHLDVEEYLSGFESGTRIRVRTQAHNAPQGLCGAPGSTIPGQEGSQA